MRFSTENINKKYLRNANIFLSKPKKVHHRNRKKIIKIWNGWFWVIYVTMKIQFFSIFI